MSDVVNNIRARGQTHAMDLIFFPLIVLILVGLVTNTLSASALSTTPTLPFPYCTGNIEPGECYPTNVNGCDLSVSNCNFTASTRFSFLSANSPFTALFSGNLAQFANTFTAASQVGNPTSTPFAFFPNATQTIDSIPNGTGTTFFVSCLNANGTIWHDILFNNEKLMCWQSFSNSTIVPELESKMFAPFPPVVSTGANLNCTVVNDAITDFTYQFIGCDNLRQNTITPILAQMVTVILAFNSTTIAKSPNGGNSSGVGVYLFGQAWMPDQQGGLPFNTTNSNDMSVCFDIPSASVNYGVSQTSSCQIASTSVHQTICSSSAGSSDCNQSTGVGAFLLSIGLIAGIVFLILGLGLQLNIGIFTAAFGIGSNEQGTKLMQALGIGLISWTFVYSEFGNWISSLPLGLNVILFVVLTTMYFFGLYWRLFSWE